MLFERITIIGVGLIGASFALAMKKYKLCKYIIGNGRNPENLKRAKEKGIIDSYEIEPETACINSDLILFSTPVGCFINIAKKIKPSLKTGAIVTDVGSVKGKLVKEMENLMPKGVTFVGAHPIAGSDKSGIESASAQLFSGAKCIITPSENTDKNALQQVIRIWETFGSEIRLIEPEEHDRIYALVSHLPHVIAYAIMNTIADVNSSYLKFSGQGFIDTTRIASSSPELWRDICILNKDNLLKSLDTFKKNLDKIIQHIRASDAISLEKDFAKARALRQGIGQD
jgi:prephenate dehydrogenase